MTSLAQNIVWLAAMEGKEVAIKEAEQLRDSLETLMETGGPNEIRAATFLLGSVQQGIKEIFEGTLVEVAKLAMEGRIGVDDNFIGAEMRARHREK